MNGRKAKVTQWLDNISDDLLYVYEVFNSGLVIAEDIGATEISMIKSDIEHLLKVIDDVIFKLEN
jgi:hypothetical protein